MDKSRTVVSWKVKDVWCIIKKRENVKDMPKNCKECKYKLQYDYYCKKKI